MVKKIIMMIRIARKALLKWTWAESKELIRIVG